MGRRSKEQMAECLTQCVSRVLDPYDSRDSRDSTLGRRYPPSKALERPRSLNTLTLSQPIPESIDKSKYDTVRSEYLKITRRYCREAQHIIFFLL